MKNGWKCYALQQRITVHMFIKWIISPLPGETGEDCLLMSICLSDWGTFQDDNFSLGFWICIKVGIYIFEYVDW